MQSYPKPKEDAANVVETGKKLKIVAVGDKDYMEPPDHDKWHTAHIDSNSSSGGAWQTTAPDPFYGVGGWSALDEYTDHVDKRMMQSESTYCPDEEGKFKGFDDELDVKALVIDYKKEKIRMQQEAKQELRQKVSIAQKGKDAIPPAAGKNKASWKEQQEKRKAMLKKSFKVPGAEKKEDSEDSSSSDEVAPPVEKKAKMESPQKEESKETKPTLGGIANYSSGSSSDDEDDKLDNPFTKAGKTGVQDKLTSNEKKDEKSTSNTKKEGHKVAKKVTTGANVAEGVSNRTPNREMAAEAEPMMVMNPNPMAAAMGAAMMMNQRAMMMGMMNAMNNF